MKNEFSNCRIINIRRGKKEQGRDHLIYAELVNDKGETLIAATLDYIVAALTLRLN